MRKICAIIALVAIALSLFAGCQSAGVAPVDPDVLNHAALSQETMDAVDRAIRDIDPSFVKVEWDFQRFCYGTINGCVIVNVDRFGMMHPAIIWSTKVGDYVFLWDHPTVLYAFKDGEVCTLSDAYQKGWLNDEHIRQLYDYHEDLCENFPKYFKEYLGE